MTANPPHIIALLDQAKQAQAKLIDVIAWFHRQPGFVGYLDGDQLPEHLEATRNRLRDHLRARYIDEYPIGCSHYRTDLAGFLPAHQPGQIVCTLCYMKVPPAQCCVGCLADVDSDDAITAIILEPLHHVEGTDRLVPAFAITARQCSSCAAAAGYGGPE